MDAERLEKIFINVDATVRHAIESIDAGAVEIALVVRTGAGWWERSPTVTSAAP